MCPTVLSFAVASLPRRSPGDMQRHQAFRFVSKISTHVADFLDRFLPHRDLLRAGRTNLHMHRKDFETNIKGSEEQDMTTRRSWQPSMPPAPLPAARKARRLSDRTLLGYSCIDLKKCSQFRIFENGYLRHKPKPVPPGVNGFVGDQRLLTCIFCLCRRDFW